MPLILRGSSQIEDGLPIPIAKQGPTLEDDTRLSLTDRGAPNVAIDAAKSVCTLVSREYLVKSSDSTYFSLAGTMFSKPYSDLEAATRSSIRRDITRKQEQVAAYFQPRSPETEPLYQEKLKQVKRLRWPPAETQPLQIKWANEPVIGIGTGYYLGNNLMATASHCLDESRGKPNWAEGLYAVFNMVAIDAKTKIPAANVFKLRRTVLKTTLPDDDELYVDGSLTIDTAKLDVYQRRYDMAVVEINPAGANGTQLPPPLAPDVIPVQQADRVYSVGSPRGLALRYSSGGQVNKRGPGLSFNGGSFNVDLDAFHGNSGGPVLRSGSNRVIGTSTSMYPRDFPLSYSSEKYSDLFYDLQKWSGKVPPGQPGSKALQDDFLTSYPLSDCCDYPPDAAHNGEMTILSWARTTPRGNFTARGGCTTRFDPFAHLFESLARFDNVNAPRPSGDSSIRVHVPLAGKSAPGTRYSIRVEDTQNTVYSSQSVVKSPNFDDGDQLIFGRDSSDNSNPADAQIMASSLDFGVVTPTPRHALLQGSIWNAANPLLWRTVTIVSSTGWHEIAMPDQQHCSIALTYNRRAGNTGGVNPAASWTAETFLFRAPIRWNPAGPQDNNWVGYIGDRDRPEGRKNESWWDGPL